MGEGNKFRFGEGCIMGGRKKNQILDLGNDVLLEDGKKKENFRFWAWCIVVDRFQIWGRMDVLLVEGMKNQISDLGNDVLLGKETKFQIWERMRYWGKGKNQILDLGHDVLCGKVKTIKLQIWPIWPFSGLGLNMNCLKEGFFFFLSFFLWTFPFSTTFIWTMCRHT